MSALILQFPQRLGPRRQKRYARNRKPCSITDIRPQPNQQSPQQPGQTPEQQAYALYLEAFHIDETPEHYNRADSLYRQAIDLAPDSATAAIAWTNLGNVRFRMRDTEAAEHCYYRALALNPSQPEALYNTARIILEGGDTHDIRTKAIPLFERCLAADPQFSDAYFNLAMALEQIGEANTARCQQCWRIYLKQQAHSPDSPWYEIAKRHVTVKAV